MIGDRQTLRAHYPVEVGFLKLKNTVVQFGEVTKGRTKTAFLDGYNQSSDTIHPSISGLPPYIVADIAPRAVPPGEQVTFTLFFDSSKAKDQWGLSTSQATISPDPLSSLVKEVSLVAIVNEDFSKLTPQQREKRQRPPTPHRQSTLAEYSAEKWHTPNSLSTTIGKSPLIIRRASCPEDFVKVKCGKEKSIPAHRLRLQSPSTPARCRPTQALSTQTVGNHQRPLAPIIPDTHRRRTDRLTCQPKYNKGML